MGPAEVMPGARKTLAEASSQDSQVLYGNAMLMGDVGTSMVSRGPL